MDLHDFAIALPANDLRRLLNGIDEAQTDVKALTEHRDHLLREVTRLKGEADAERKDKLARAGDNLTVFMIVDRVLKEEIAAREAANDRRGLGLVRRLKDAILAELEEADLP